MAGAVLSLARLRGSILYEGQLAMVPVLARFESLSLALSQHGGGAHTTSLGLWKNREEQAGLVEQAQHYLGDTWGDMFLG